MMPQPHYSSAKSWVDGAIVNGLLSQNTTTRRMQMSKDMSEGLILWEHNPARSFIADLTDDEIELLNADIQDAIDGVMEDWSTK
jgi:hypothetical protein